MLIENRNLLLIQIPPMNANFEVVGQNVAALFSLKVYRGDGMALLAMNWKEGQPPQDFVGFAIDAGAGRRQVFRLEKPAGFSRLGRLGQSEPALNHTFAHSKVSLGAFSA